jgi:hypothetical protein
MQEPFALQLYWLVQGGVPAERLARDLDIPLDRIELRLRAAARYLERQQEVPRTVSGLKLGSGASPGAGTTDRQFPCTAHDSPRKLSRVLEGQARQADMGGSCPQEIEGA